MSVVTVAHNCSYQDCENPATMEVLLQVRELSAIVELPRLPYKFRYACHMHWQYIKSALGAVGELRRISEDAQD